MSWCLLEVNSTSIFSSWKPFPNSALGDMVGSTYEAAHYISVWRGRMLSRNGKRYGMQTRQRNRLILLAAPKKSNNKIFAHSFSCWNRTPEEPWSGFIPFIFRWHGQKKMVKSCQGDSSRPETGRPGSPMSVVSSTFKLSKQQDFNFCFKNMHTHFKVCRAGPCQF